MDSLHDLSTIRHANLLSEVLHARDINYSTTMPHDALTDFNFSMHTLRLLIHERTWGSDMFFHKHDHPKEILFYPLRLKI